MVRLYDKIITFIKVNCMYFLIFYIEIILPILLSVFDLAKKMVDSFYNVIKLHK